MSQASAKLRCMPTGRGIGPTLPYSCPVVDGAASSGSMKTSATARLNLLTLTSMVGSTASCAVRFDHCNPTE